MPGRIFISCGQATPQERRAATAVRKWFAAEGFEPYVAIEAQSLTDVNSGIIDQLKRADFYVFIDFRRERLQGRPGIGAFWRRRSYRGSLFTNQELAVAFLLEFEKAIFLQQDGVRLEGLLRYMGSNAQRFELAEEVPDLVGQLVEARSWSPAYTRHLTVGEEHWTPPLTFEDHTGQSHVRVFEVDIQNLRRDLGALNAIARLRKVVDAVGNVLSGVDTSPLKTTGHFAYRQAIWPESHAAWDLLAVRMDVPATLALNSSLDVVPRSPIISTPGKYSLSYEIFAEGFPVLTFDVELAVADDPLVTSASVQR